MRTTLVCLFLALPMSMAGQTPTLGQVKKLFIEKLPNDLDQYLKAEIFKQAKGRLTIVLDKADSDGILTGVSEQEAGALKQVTGRYLGLHDTATGSLSLLDKTGKTILWADEAGDRSLMFGVMRRGGERKVAERLVKKMIEAMVKDGKSK